MMAPARTTDDFDMAKLQKSLKQQQRRSTDRPNVTKLTPAEIRSLNNGALASKVGSQSSSHSILAASIQRRSTATPPSTPDHPSAYRAQVSRASTISLPTPPHSPNPQQRRGSGPNGHQNGHIYAPKPRTSVQADFMMVNGHTSRPSSAASLTYRGLPTYRGPEMTRTGSHTMLQRPSPTIVTNPLSNFSRPRQSMVNSSPVSVCRHDFSEMDPYQAQTMLNRRSMSMESESASSRDPSPPRATESPDSIAAGDTDNISGLDSESKHEKDDLVMTNGVAVTQNGHVDNGEPAPMKEVKKRFSFGPGFFEKKDKEKDKTSTLLKKQRRRTLSFTKSREEDNPADDKLVSGPEYNSQRNSVDVDNAKEEFATHPAVRPLSSLSLIIPQQDPKGKAREINSAPVYGRCACCGKLKRPSNYTSELSPVLENENLRANFSFEIERSSLTSAQRPGSSASRSRYTPIIPMAMSATETRQATIEPYSPPSRAETPSVVGSTATRGSKRSSDPPKIVRFASLHGQREGDGEVSDEDLPGREELVEDSIPVQDNVNVIRHASHLHTEAETPAASGALVDAPESAASTVPVEIEQPLQPTERTSLMPKEPAQLPAEQTPLLLDQQTQHLTESTILETPASQQNGHASPPAQTPKTSKPKSTPKGTSRFLYSAKPKPKRPPPPQTSPPPTDPLPAIPDPASNPTRVKSFKALPTPHLGPHFARSNGSLRNWVSVTPVGEKTALLTDVDVDMELEREERDRVQREKWVEEVMAV